MEPPAKSETTHWLARLQAGDPAAMGVLLESHRNYTAVLVRLQLGSQLRVKLDVEDLVQEVFLEAHRASSRFKGVSRAEFLAWLRRIIAGVLANQMRRYLGARRRDVRLEESLAEDLERSSRRIDRALIAPGETPSEEVSRIERAVWLADAIETLPPDYRSVILLRHFEDLSFQEIATQMGRSLDSVKNLWIRALARIRRKGAHKP